MKLLQGWGCQARKKKKVVSYKTVSGSFLGLWNIKYLSEGFFSLLFFSPLLLRFSSLFPCSIFNPFFSFFFSSFFHGPCLALSHFPCLFLFICPCLSLCLSVSLSAALFHFDFCVARENALANGLFFNVSSSRYCSTVHFAGIHRKLQRFSTVSRSGAAAAQTAAALAASEATEVFSSFRR